MKKRIFLVLCLIVISTIEMLSCTSAIIGADLNPYGRPLLWKNRDTSNIDNKIEYIPGKQDEFAYVALFNSTDTLLREAWMGMNEYGFAVMNTASYNIKDDDLPEKEMDKEGLLMTKALKKCKTVDDFANFLDTLPRPFGVEANFGVIDAYGNGAFFETNNHSYVKFDLKDEPDDLLIRTNYSKSGRENEGFGFIREANAKHLLQPYVESKNITPEVLTEVLSKSFWHDLIQKDFSNSGDRWVIDQDFIPRYKSTATVVIEGCVPLTKEAEVMPEELIREYVMWTGLGYPPCAEIFPVFCKENGFDESLKGTAPGGNSPQCDIVKSRRSEVFPFTMGNGDKYIDMSKLFNEEGSGYVQTIVPQNLETYRKTREILSRNN